MGSEHFERLSHVVYGGAAIDLPLLVHPEFGLSDDSVALLHAADIIGGNPTAYGNNLGKLLEEIGTVMIHQTDHDGLIIEDELGAGSISVGREETTVTIEGIGVLFTLKTTLLFDMVYAWTHEEYYGLGKTNGNETEP